MVESEGIYSLVFYVSVFSACDDQGSVSSRGWLGAPAILPTSGEDRGRTEPPTTGD